MGKSVCILGRQPALGLAELESLYGSETVLPIGNTGALLNLEADHITMSRLGGSLKLGRYLTELPYTDWGRIEQFLTKQLPDYTADLEPGKIRLGLSLYGFNIHPRKLNATGLTLKKAIRQTSKSVRVVPNKTSELNAAQVIHNQLTGPSGFEVLLIKHQDKTIVAQTIAVQDINAYAARDQARPKRDARVGMLPPKLAQIIINLATGEKSVEAGEWKSGSATVLDPFCGTGVVLQETMLMGYNAYGTDLEPRMVEYTATNLDWLNITSIKHRVNQGDAMNKEWVEPFSVIAGETYLGRPFSTVPRPEKLREVMQDVDTIHREFLQNVARQTKKGFRLCIAVPAWYRGDTGGARAVRASAVHGADEQRTEPYIKYGEGVAQSATKHSAASKGGVTSTARKQVFATDRFWHLPVLDNIEELGYTRQSFVHVSKEDLIYHREGQIVGRELVVLQRN
ncbi:MAG: hypothetical protein U5K77_00590 [Candidatus Saccharibacteria bacterium]|nr:hypothetical protein [Candidatus Saccharibacteria bacterium]